MSTSFLALPAPAANGSGAAVDVSTFGATKTVVVEGNGSDSEPFVIIEIANDAAGVKWSTLTMFIRPGEKTFAVACRWMRATVTNYSGGGAPVVNVGGEDIGTSFATLVAPANNGNGAGVDVSALPAFKTIQIKGAFAGCVTIEVSNDGGATYSLATAFQPNKNGFVSGVLVADFMRVNRSGISPGATPGLPVINIGASSQSGGGAAGINLEQGGVPVAGGPFSTLNFIGATAADAGGGTADVTVTGAGTQPWFGSAVDGTVVAGALTNQTQSMFYEDLTIPDNGVYNTGGYQLFVNGTLTLGANAVIDNSGQPGGNGGVALGGAGGLGGGGGMAQQGVTPLDPGFDGGAGAADGEAPVAGGAGNGSNQYPVKRAPGNYQAGDGGNVVGAAGGAGYGSAAQDTIPINSLWQVTFGQTGVDVFLGPGTGIGGRGGGGGAADGTGVGSATGGGGGGGGGLMTVCARTIVAQGTSRIRTKGGDGGNGTGAAAGGAAGGGGGTGGILHITTETDIDTLYPALLDVAGGAGGIGVAPGGDGTVGDDGYTIKFIVT